MDFSLVFKEKDAQEHLSKLSLTFIASNPAIRAEFIQYTLEQHRNDLESYFKVLTDYLEGKGSVMPPPLFLRNTNMP